MHVFTCYKNNNNKALKSINLIIDKYFDMIKFKNVNALLY